MSHGHTVAKVGDCPICERRNVELRQYTTYEGVLALACVDLHACANELARVRRRR